MKPKNSLRLFVYGTLRKGFPLHQYLNKPAVRYVGKGEIKGRLYDLGDYPGILPAIKGENVQGEVYELFKRSDLAEIDRLEEYFPNAPSKSLFVRKKAKVKLENGKVVPAWTYFLPRKPKKAQLIEEGDYQKSSSGQRR